MESDPQPIFVEETALKAGQRVVYPNQGVCRICGIEVKEIGGLQGEFLTMKREEDGATVMIPRSKIASIGLRHVAARSEVEAILRFLEADGDDPELDWKVRHRTHSDKMVGGSLVGTAEVLKGLHSLALLRPLPPRERELYDSARHLLLHEFAVSLGLSLCSAEDTLDVCLTPIAGSPRAKALAQRSTISLADALALGDDLPEPLIAEEVGGEAAALDLPGKPEDETEEEPPADAKPPKSPRLRGARAKVTTAKVSPRPVRRSKSKPTPKVKRKVSTKPSRPKTAKSRRSGAPTKGRK